MRKRSHHSRQCCIGICFAIALIVGTLPVNAADAPAPQAPQSPSELDSLLDLPLEQLAKTPVRGGTEADPVSTTVSRVEEKVSEAPGSVYVYTREMIIKRGYRSLGDLLQVVPGFTVYHRDLEFVAGVRGLNANDNEKITLLINGEEFNNLQEPNFLNGPINLDNVDRVEVVVGPSSFFQRANTLAATINVITRDTEGTELIASSGSALPYSGTFMTGHKWASDDTISFSFTTERKTGFDAWNHDFRPGLTGRNLTGELDEPNFFSVLKRQYGEWTFQGTAYRTQSPELNIDNGSLSNNGVNMNQMFGLYAKNEHPLNDDLTRVISADAIYKEQARYNAGGPPTPFTLEGSGSQMAYSAEYGYRYTGIEHHLIQTGVQFEYDENLHNYYVLSFSPTPSPPVSLVDRNSQELGLYVDDEIQLTDRLKVIAGVRQDHNTLLPGDKWYTGLRSAIVYQTTDNWVTKAMFNRAVRMPSAVAALNSVFGSNNPNPPPWAGLAPTPQEPETLSTVELQNTFTIEKLRLGINVYHEDLDNYISWFQPWTNVGTFQGTGVELTAREPIGERTVLWANTSYCNSTLQPFEPYAPKPGPVDPTHMITNAEGRIIGSPLWTANLGVDRQITDHITFSPSVRYFTEQAAFDWATQDFITVRNIFYFDATLTWKAFLTKNMDLRLSLYNITDNRDQIAAQWTADTYRPRGISGVASIYWRF